MTAVVDAEDRVLGVFTDGDLRRALDRAADLRTHADATEVMTRRAKTVQADDARRRGSPLMESTGSPRSSSSTARIGWSARSTCTISCARVSFERAQSHAARARSSS